MPIVERAVHRLEAKLGLLGRHRREHRVGEILFVPAGPPQVAPGDVRRVDQAVAALQQLLTEVVLHLLADDTALRVPEDQALAVLLVNREEIELTAKPAVVASLGLLPLVDPRLQLRSCRKGGAVDALHLRTPGVTLPVRAREREELEGLQSVGGGHVRTEAEVDEGGAVDVVDADLLGALVLDQLALQGLVALREDAQGLELR